MKKNSKYLFKSVRLIANQHPLIPTNTVGTVLEVYDDSFCEVEFNNPDGSTLYLGSFCFDDLEFIDKDK